MHPTHVYQAGPGNTTARMVCNSCGCVATRQSVIVAVDPRPGQGARSLAERLKRRTPTKKPEG